MTPGATLDHDTLGPVLVTLVGPGYIQVRRHSGHHTTLWPVDCMTCRQVCGWAEVEGSTGVHSACAGLDEEEAV